MSRKNAQLVPNSSVYQKFIENSHVSASSGIIPSLQNRSYRYMICYHGNMVTGNVIVKTNGSRQTLSDKYKM